MARKLMVCSKCSNMFGVEVARLREETLKCPKCESSDVMGVYEYWKSVPTGSPGFRRKEAPE